MNQTVELVRVILVLKKEVIDYDYVINNLDKFDDIKRKYSKIDWDFLYDVKNKSREEIDNWIEICTKTVHIL